MHAVPLERRGMLAESAAGLSSAEAAARLAVYGPNDVLETVRRPWSELVRETAGDPMIWFLLATGGVELALGQRTEGWILLGATVPLVAMDAWLNRRVQASTRALGSTLAATARVLRDGREHTVPARDLVPGDVVRVAPAETIPADGVVLADEDAQVDESALTGEAWPARKRAWSGLADGAIDDEAWASAGTRLLAGTVYVRVVLTGADTLYGTIVRTAAGRRQARTPLQAGVARLVAVLSVAAAILCALLAVVRLLQGHGLLDALVTAATLAVAVLPEEYPVALTVFLGVGALRLARQRALVRRSVAVETTGRVTTICTDKTGTLTEGRLRLARIVPFADVDPAFVLDIAAEASRTDSGDPVDRAILDAAGPRPSATFLATFPFTEQRRRETRIVVGPAGARASTKGAPEEVAARCSDVPPALAGTLHALASEGRKTLAVAWRAVEVAERAEPDGGYRLAGLLAFEDPVRPSVPGAVAECRAAGIRVVVLTGDHAATAAAIAARIGLGPGGEPRVVDGAAWRARREAGGGTADVDVVARALPTDKLAFVEAARAEGAVVAYTGDGVNDVPALQAADVGIAMGLRGTRSAREAAQIVLADDDFGTLVGAIAEGRRLFRELQASYQYLLLVHLALFVTATVIPLAGYPVLYEPAHVVWLEAIIHPSALLAFQDLPATGPLQPSARRPAAILTKAQWIAALTVGAALALVVGWAWIHGRDESTNSDPLGHARALAMTAMVVGSCAAVAWLSGLRTRAARLVVAAALCGSALVLQIPALAQALHMAPPHLDDWVLTIGLAVGAVYVPAWAVGRARARGRGIRGLPSPPRGLASAR